VKNFSEQICILRTDNWFSKLISLKGGEIMCGEGKDEYGCVSSYCSGNPNLGYQMVYKTKPDGTRCDGYAVGCCNLPTK